MNRNEEWKYFVKEINGNVPPAVENSLQRAVSRMKNKKNIQLLVTAPLGGALVLIAVFAALENTSPGFARTTKSIPLLRRFAKLVVINPNLKGIIYEG